jgi:hypothetical protein
MKNSHFHIKLSEFRFEFLLVALMMLIFNKIFISDNETYLRYIWPLNMVLISVASYGMFVEHSKPKKVLRNVLAACSIAMPFLFIKFGGSLIFLRFLSIFFVIYYSFIFSEVMYQITRAREVRLNVIIGSFCGYMLLSMIALFSYLIIELNTSGSFEGISRVSSLIYNELSYFSFITLTSIGFGDIHPITDTSRLTVAFFGMAGQFYMVAVMGIIISRFSADLK